MQSITITILAVMVGFLSWELSKIKEEQDSHAEALDYLYTIVVTMINNTQGTIDFGIDAILIEEQGDEDGE